MKSYNAGKEVEVSESNSSYYDSIIEVLKTEIVEGSPEHPSKLLRGGGRFLAITLHAVCLEWGLNAEFEVYQKLFTDKNGKLNNPINKGGYQKKDGTTATPTLIYDMLAAARELGDDRFGKGFHPDLFKGLKFRMGVKEGKDSEGNPFYILETSYQKARDVAYRASTTLDNTVAVESALDIDEEDLPF